MPNACSDYRPHIGAGSIGDGVFTRGFDSHGVNVRTRHGAAQQLRRGDSQDACASPNIKDLPWTPAFQYAIQRPQAAKRRAMMASAKGQGGLDFDAYVVAAQLLAVVRAMYKHATGADRVEAGQRVLNPVLLGYFRKLGGFGGFGARDGGHECANQLFVRGLAKKDFHSPGGAVLLFEGGGRGFSGIECFDYDVGDCASAALVGDEPHHIAGAIGGQTFKHGPRLTRRDFRVTFHTLRGACILPGGRGVAFAKADPSNVRGAGRTMRGEMTEKLSICLVGPKNGGKSSLLASLTDCVAQSAFGYPVTLRPALQAIGESEILDASASTKPQDIFVGPNGDYEKLRRDFVEGGVATDTLDTYEYYFRLALHGSAPPAVMERGPWLLEVVDAAGELAVPPEGARVAILNDVKDKFAGQLLAAQAIVLVLPMVRLEDCNWIATLARLVDRLARNRDKRLRRLVVAFSQYERLFVNLGPSAFTYACDPAVALHMVRKSLRAAPWMDALRALDVAGVSVRFTVTSAYGFTKRFQNPNIDPHQPGEGRFRRPGVESARGFAEYWRPFLTAEPILYAALDLDSAFTFSYRQVDARGEVQ